jgi:hypothetical protein
MSQEITIMCLIDVQAAVEENSLEGNLYFIDNLGRDGSQNECSADLIVAANGTHWADGSQANEVLINWLCNGIGSLPIALSRVWHQVHSKKIDQSAIDRLNNIHKDFSDGDKEVYKSKIGDLLSEVGHSSMVRHHEGHLVNTAAKLQNVYGELFNPHADGWDTISHMTPFIADVTGEAVDKGVMFPTQEGTPIHVKDGWYWCATINTKSPGVYDYDLHFVLHKLAMHDGQAFWEPITFSVRSKIQVTSQAKINGFSGAAIEFLPLPAK